MGMFDTIHLKGKVKEVVENNIEGIKNGELQIKELDLCLFNYDIGDDLILKVSEEGNRGGPGHEYFDSIALGKFSQIVESRWSSKEGFVYLGFTNNKLIFIANIKTIGWYPLKHPQGDDVIIFFDETPVVHVLDHKNPNVDQRALDTHYAIVANEISESVHQNPLCEALESHYNARKVYDFKVKDPEAFRNLLKVRGEAFHQAVIYGKSNVVGINEMLSTMAIMGILHRNWINSQTTSNDISYGIDAVCPNSGFDNRFPAELLCIFEESWKNAFGTEVNPSHVRPNNDFSEVVYKDDN